MNDYHEYDNYEDYDHDNATCSYDENDDEGDENEGESQAKKQKNDSYNNNTDNEKTSRFSNMANRFKAKDVCGEKIDVLAQNVTSLFLNGMAEEQYNYLVKDEKTPRPENCEGLKIVKTNQLVWDIIPTFSQTCDKKMQNIEKTSKSIYNSDESS